VIARGALAMLAAVALAGACKREAAPKRQVPGPTDDAAPLVETERIRILVGKLQSTDEAVRERALDDLRAFELTAGEGIQLLEATRLAFPAHEGIVADIPGWIMIAVGKAPDERYIPVVERLFPGWRPGLRAHALGILRYIDTPAAADAAVRLFVAHGRDLVADEEAGYDAALAMLEVCEARKLTPGRLAPAAPWLIEQYREQRDWLKPRQQTTGVAWRVAEDYAPHRDRAALFLDLLGCLPATTVEVELRDALTFRDPRLVFFAATSLLSAGATVSPETLELVAASPEMRGHLLTELERTGRRALFPARFLTQAALAESDMVRWLAFPTELGQPPDEIELVKVVSRDTPDGPADLYLFKFRTHAPHWAAKDGWMAGVSGPFLRADPPTSAGDGTFSSFEPWGARSEDGHVAKVEKILADWAAARP
jgi:hypothetical protein